MKKIATLLCLTCLLQGCGTLLKPQQVNRPHSNQLDSKIVLLDGIGLIFFVVPGVVAYAVDYANGTLYLAHGQKVALQNTSNADIKRALEKATGKQVNLNNAEEIPVKQGMKTLDQPA